MSRLKRLLRDLFSVFACGLVGLFWVLCFSKSVFATCSASMTTSGTVKLDIGVNGAGVIMDEIVVNTDCGGGYSVSISGPADSNLYLGGDSTNTNIINITSGTQANPSAIFTTGNNSYANTWGYSTATATTVTSSTFVGLTNESVQIFDKEIASEIGGDEYVVYYGASVSSLMPAGTYKMADDAAIVYYLTARSLEFEVVGNPTEWTNQSATLTVVSASSDKISEYSFDGGETWQSSPDKIFDVNTSNIEVKIKSTAGWISPSQIIDITKIDKIAPVITFDNDTEYNSDHTTKQVTTLIATLGENTGITTGVNVSDSLSGVASGWPKCYRDNAEIGSTDYFTNVGRYAIVCKVQDNAGNETVENREVLIRWPLAGKYVVAKTEIDGAGIAGTGLSSSTSTNGLYRDTAATGANVGLPFASKYYYTGPTVDNYISFAGSTFRILNIPTNDDLKLLGDLSDKKTNWGSQTNSRKIYLSQTYNTWSTQWWPNWQIYNNESGESKYKVFNATERTHIDLATFYAGRFNKADAQDISDTVHYEQTGNVNLGGDDNAAFEGYSAYPNVSDYLKASKAHDVVKNIDDTQDDGILGIGTTKRDIFNANSWIDMSEDQWTMNSKNLTNTDNDFWVLDGTVHGRVVSRTYYYSQQYRVVFYLKNDTILSGDGSSGNPYTVQEDWAWFDSEQVLQ